MVMRPEPLGEALRRTGGRRRDPAWCRRRRVRRSARRWPASCPTRERLVFAVRPLRGDRPAGRSTTPRPGAEVVEVSLGDYVLNGGEVAALADHRGGGPAAARLHGQRRVAGRGVARGRAAGVPRLHAAGLVARPRRARGAAVRRPRGDRGLAPRAGAAAYGAAPARPAAPQRRRQPSGRSCPRGRATPASCSPCSGRAGCRRRWPTTASPTSRRSTSRCADVQEWMSAWSTWVVRSAGAAGRRGPRPARGLPAGAGLGHRPDHGRARPPGPRAGPAAARAHRGGGRARGDVVRPVHRRPQRRQHPDVPEGRLPGPHRPRGTAAAPWS